MLDGFKNFIDKLAAFDFGREMETIVEENADKLPPMVQKQLAAGLDGGDQPNTIFGRSGYSPRTVEIKEANGVGLGAVTDRITNYMTGAFYESLQADVANGAFEINSDVPYASDIALYSSPRLLEVDEDNRKEFAETVTLPAIKEALLTKTGIEITTT